MGHATIRNIFRGGTAKVIGNNHCMALCDWCGKTEKNMAEIPNGRTNLRLCAFCKAEYDVKQGGAIVLPASGPPKPNLSWWERMKRLF